MEETKTCKWPLWWRHFYVTTLHRIYLKHFLLLLNNFIMWAKTWQKLWNNAASYFARPSRMCTQLLDVLLVEAFCSLRRAQLDGLNSSGFSFIFHPTLELANIYRCIPRQRFLCWSRKKIDNEALKAFQQNSFSPTVCGPLLVSINSIQRERFIQTSLPVQCPVARLSVHQVISDNRRLWEPGHRGGGGDMDTQPSGDLNDIMCSKCDYWKVWGYTVST